MANKDFSLINTHIPYEGELPQTDAFVPYNEIEANLNHLPADKDARIVLYCRSGRMQNWRSNVCEQDHFGVVVEKGCGCVTCH